MGMNEHNTQSLLSAAELAVVHKLAEAWNQFLALESIHPEDSREFMHAIHEAQRIVMSRPVSRQIGR